MSGNETIEIDVEFLGETDKAILVSDGDIEVWLPKSQVEYDGAMEPDGQMIAVEMPEWLAEDKGFI